MTDHSCSRAELSERRIIVDLSDADLARLTSMAARRHADVQDLVLGWIRRGLASRGGWDESRDRTDQVAHDVEVAQRSERLFGDLLRENDVD